MADDPIAEQVAKLGCPNCGAAKQPGLAWLCGSREIRTYGDSPDSWTSVFEQSEACKIIASVTAERDHFRRRYVELYSTVWGEQYDWFEDSDQKHAEAMQEVERCSQALAERDQLRDSTDHAVAEAKRRVPDYPWTLNTASEAVWALGESLRAAKADNAELRVLAGLLEQRHADIGQFSLPGAIVVFPDSEENCWHFSRDNVYDATERYPTALAAIRAGMGWDREGT